MHAEQSDGNDARVSAGHQGRRAGAYGEEQRDLKSRVTGNHYDSGSGCARRRGGVAGS